MRREYWRWAEKHWRAEDIDWRKGDIVSAGIDVGSVSSQAVVLVDGQLWAWASIRTGSSSPDSARNAMARALEDTGMEPGDVHFVVSTGYGRSNVPWKHKAISEIHCHARGANFMYGDRIRTLLDMGGQDCKAIRCDADGKVQTFQMNEKCAAGTGRGMEVFADLFQVPIEEVGPLSLSVEEEPPPVSNTCVVFAKSEALTLIRAGWGKERVLAAYCGAMALRVASLLESVGVEPDFAITGGIAKNPGVVRRIERTLGMESATTDIDTQIAGALGAAIIARSREEKRRAKADRRRP